QELLEFLDGLRVADVLFNDLLLPLVEAGTLPAKSVLRGETNSPLQELTFRILFRGGQKAVCYQRCKPTSSVRICSPNIAMEPISGSIGGDCPCLRHAKW